MPRRKKETRRFKGVRAPVGRVQASAAAASPGEGGGAGAYDREILANFPGFLCIHGHNYSKRAGRKPLAPSLPRDDSLPPRGKRAVTSTIEAKKAALVRDAQLVADERSEA